MDRRRGPVTAGTPSLLATMVEMESSQSEGSGDGGAEETGPPGGRAPAGRDEGSLALLREQLAPDLRVLRPLGRGKMAEVVLAREPALMRLVAVKVLARELADDATAVRRFEREAKSAAAVSHPNIVAVYRVARLGDGRPYLVMQYVEGRTLAERIRAEGTLDPDAARSVLRELASALAAAHARGIVHRDVRPGNVLQEQASGRTLLADFGIAAILSTGDRDPVTRLTRADEVLGEARYTSPEQLRGDEPTPQSDVYGLGLVGYEILAGRGPFEGRSSADLARAHLIEEPRPVRELRPEVPADLSDLLLRCLAKSPEHRPGASRAERELAAPRSGTEAGGGAPEREGRVAGGVAAAGSQAAAPARSTADRAAGTPADEAEDSGTRWLGRLRKRRVPQIVGSFAAVGWLSLQAVDQLVANDMLPPRAYPLCVAFFLAGLPASFLLAWFHGEPGQQRVHAVEMWLFGILGFAWVITSVVILLG